MKNPIDLGGKKASQMLTKTKRGSGRRRRRNEDNSESSGSSSEDEEEATRKKRKKKEEEKYKSAQFIEDSDAEFDEDAFFKKERERRERNEQLAEEGKIVAMKSTGTKKRRKKVKEGVPKKRPKGSSAPGGSREAGLEGEESSASDTDSQVASKVVPARPRPKPKPRPRSPPEASGDTATKGSSILSNADDLMNEDISDLNTSDDVGVRPRHRSRAASDALAEESSEGPGAHNLSGLSSPVASSPRNAAEQSSVEVDSDLEAMSLKPISKKPRKLVFSDDEDE